MNKHGWSDEMAPIFRQRNAALADKLASGEYEQGHSYLHLVTIVMIEGTETEKHQWCCLGVAADLAEKAGLPVIRNVGPQFTDHNGVDVKIENFDQDSAFPSQKVVDYYGWDNYNPRLLAENGREVRAATLNDQGETYEGPAYTFAQIADAFRRTFVEE